MAKLAGFNRRQGSPHQLRLKGMNSRQLLDEPRVNTGTLGNLIGIESGRKCLMDVQKPFGGRTGETSSEGRLVENRILQSTRLETFEPDLKRTQCFLEGLAKGSPNSHHLSHRLHRRGKRRVRIRKLFEGESRDLGHDVIDGWFETGGCLTSDVVPKLVEGVANSQLCCNLCNRESRSLGCKRRTARHSRIHLNDHHSARTWAGRELDIAATRLDSDFPYACKGCIPHELVFLVRESHGGSHGD